MPLLPTPWIGRRELVLGVTALAAAPRALAADGRLVATPRQTEGPFYPVEWAGDVDNDLVTVTGKAARAIGQVVHVQGRILGVDGRPLPGAGVEIWQCDANGIYRHPRDEGRGRSRDAGFQGRGRARAGDDGAYRFRTIRPVAYSGRTPHIHFRVITPDGRRLTTQMYVAGDPGNARDGVLNGIRDPRQRDSVIVRFDPADRLETGAQAGTFDIVVV
jgi:protocatechuate 3,4-dioxygenase beta subunit